MEVVPELAGALAGFAQSIEAHDGLHALLDVGGLTVDAAFFRLDRVRNDAPRIKVFSALVDPLGADVTRAWAKLDPTGSRSSGIPPMIGAFLCKPIIRGHRKLPDHPGLLAAPRTRLFVIGGGRHSEDYRRSVQWAESTGLKNSKYETRFVEKDLARSLQHLSVPEGRKDHDRLLVAFGLSLPLDDIPEWVTPNELADQERRRPRDIGGAYDGKEHT